MLTIDNLPIHYIYMYILIDILLCVVEILYNTAYNNKNRLVVWPIFKYK